MENGMTGLKAIRTYFEQGGGKKIELAELKALKREDIDEMAPQCCTALGVEYIPKAE